MQPSLRTLYMSSYDLALHLSRWENGESRAGLKLSLSPAYESVDAAPAWNWLRQPVGHGYFAQSPAVVRDIQQVAVELPPVAAAGRLTSAFNTHGTLQLCDRLCWGHAWHEDKHYLIIP